MAMPLSENGNPNYCLDCIAKMAIRCAWCGEAISIGSPVTLYTPKEDYKIPEYATRYQNNAKSLVGCLRWNCADSGMDRQGFWMPPGKVKRVPSPLEMALASGDQVVIVSDLSDPNNLGETFPS
ncbi:MAG: hypothetical protein WCL61_02660 [bacterium]